MSQRPDYQMIFMEKLRGLLPPQQALADVLADLLHVSKDSAYRRIRGETALTLDEVLVICEQFRITFESLSNPNAVTFQFKQLKPDIESFRTYLSGMLMDLERIKSFENSEIIYAAEDIPVFHHFPYKLLSAFKTYYWMRSIMNVKVFEGTRFKAGLIPEDILELGQKIYQVYAAIPSAEIWTDETISSTLNQIEYYWEAGLFEDVGTGIAVCDDFIAELKGIQSLCEIGKKQFRPFRFYHNDIMIGNNCILIKAGTTKFCYLSHHSFNFMLTTDFAFSEETESWLDNMMRRSSLISGVSEKQRNIFFSQLINRVEGLKIKMKPTIV